MPNVIRIAAALILDEAGQTLLVRKRNTRMFMQPGGKIDAGESPVQALVRELHEELQLVIEPFQARLLGEFTAPAANEPGFEVHCTLFEVHTRAAIEPAAEIEEIVWVSEPGELALAPLTRDQVWPLYLAALSAPR